MQGKVAWDSREASSEGTRSLAWLSPLFLAFPWVSPPSSQLPSSRLFLSSVSEEKKMSSVLQASIFLQDCSKVIHYWLFFPPASQVPFNTFNLSFPEVPACGRATSSSTDLTARVFNLVSVCLSLRATLSECWLYPWGLPAPSTLTTS